MSQVSRSQGCAKLAPTVVLLLGSLLSASAQEPPATPGRAQELIERERIRSGVEAAMDLALTKTGNGARDLDNLMRAAHDLVELGDATIPYLINELERSSPLSFFFCAYTLGHFDDPEATAALERAMERADGAPGDFGLSRKGWAGYGLALQGAVAVIDDLNAGDRRASHIPIHGDVSVVEAAAILTAPASEPLLLAQLDAYAEKEWWIERRYTLLALGRVLSSSGMAKVIEVAREEDPVQRRVAVAALRRGGDHPEAIDALVVAMSDDDFRVRRDALAALLAIVPAEPLDAAVARLEQEDDFVVRGRIYRWLVEVRGEEALDTLRAHWPSEDPNDRFQLMTALEVLGSPRSMDMLEAAVLDRESRVMVRAVSTLAGLETEEGDELLRTQLMSTFWPRAQACIEQLATRPSTINGAALARRLLGVELATPITDPRMRHRVELLADALATVGHAEALPALRKQLELQQDPAVLAMLESVVLRLETVARNKKNVARWSESAGHGELAVRELAYAHLARIGGRKAAQALVAAFGRAEPDEAVVLLDRLAGVDRPETRALLRRVLVDPAFDDPDYWPLRDMAAWSARRLGGDDMIAALRESVERRDGRDAHVLAYLALTAGDEALPTLKDVRVKRMRYLKYTRGYEYETFERMIERLETGGSISAWDREPGRLDFRQ